jgi:hydrogenase maturation protease
MIGSFQSESSNHWKCLIVGYGNTLRGDDGIGPRVALDVRERLTVPVDVRVEHQLSPELAEDLAAVDVVVFLDACPASYASVVTVRQIEPAPFCRDAVAHTAGPAQLLGLTQAVYGCAPEAYVVALPAHDFGLHAGLSAAGLLTAREGVDTVLGLLERLAPAHA